MYARKGGPVLDALPAGCEGLDDAALSLRGIFHVREVAPRGYDPDLDALDLATASYDWDDAGALPLVVMTWGRRQIDPSVAADRAKQRREDANRPTLAALAELDSKRVRPTAAVVAALAAGAAPLAEDIAKLVELEAAAAALRLRLT